MTSYHDEHDTHHDARPQSYIAADTVVAHEPEVGAQIDGDVCLAPFQQEGDGPIALPTHEAVSGIGKAGNAVLGENDILDPNVPLSRLRLDGGTQSRAKMDDAAIAEYSEAIRQGATLPPLVVYFDGVDFWLADGFHRYHAYRAADVDEVAAEVRTGSRRDAVLFSVGANAAHGLRRSNEDKRRSVETLLADAEWAALSQEAIAKYCRVSTGFVSKLVNDTSIHREVMRPATRVVIRDGKTYEQDTTNIGKVKPPKPVGPVSPEAWADPGTALTPAKVMLAVDELAALMTKHSALLEEHDALKASFTATLADNESMGRIIDADDRLKAAVDEVKRQTDIAGSAETRLFAKMHECAEAVKSAKFWKKRAEKAEKLQQGA